MVPRSNGEVGVVIAVSVADILAAQYNKAIIIGSRSHCAISSLIHMLSTSSIDNNSTSRIHRKITVRSHNEP